MAWDYERSIKRVAQDDFASYEINIAPLAKTMDFENLGTHDVRRCEGAHAYVDVSNFGSLIEAAGGDQQKLRRVLRAISVLRRAYTDLILPMHDVARIQMQGARFHCISFKPYDDEDARVTAGVCAAVSLATYVKHVFNPLFEVLGPLNVRSGADVGPFYIANVGRRGNRELICIGDSANIAAKILGATSTLTITDRVYCRLPDVLKKHFSSAGSVGGNKVLIAAGLSWCEEPDTAEALGIRFAVEELTSSTESFRNALPLDQIELSDAFSRIDVEDLSERNSKLIPAVSLFADIDGFTQFIQQATEDELVKHAIRMLHAFRAEMHAVSADDYDGVVVQHQGDRLQCLLHLPSGEEEAKRCRRAVEIAIGLQSSMEHVLNPHFQDVANLHLAIGLASGLTLITRVGKKGDKDVLCLGPGALVAERLQLASDGEQIRVTGDIYQSLDDGGRTNFGEDSDSWLGQGLTFPKIEQEELEAAAERDAVGVDETTGRIDVVGLARAGSQRATPSGPWFRA